MNKVRVPGGGHADNLREVGGISGEGYAVQPLVPPVIFRQTESRDRRCVVAHLLDLLFQSHLADEIVDALADRQSRVHPGLTGRRVYSRLLLGEAGDGKRG